MATIEDTLFDVLKLYVCNVYIFVPDAVKLPKFFETGFI